MPGAIALPAHVAMVELAPSIAVVGDLRRHPNHPLTPRIVVGRDELDPPRCLDTGLAWLNVGQIITIGRTNNRRRMTSLCFDRVRA